MADETTAPAAATPLKSTTPIPVPVPIGMGGGGATASETAPNTSTPTPAPAVDERDVAMTDAPGGNHEQAPVCLPSFFFLPLQEVRINVQLAEQHLRNRLITTLSEPEVV